jgi:hypothetical protein
MDWLMGKALFLGPPFLFLFDMLLCLSLSSRDAQARVCDNEREYTHTDLPSHPPRVLREDRLHRPSPPETTAWSARG